MFVEFNNLVANAAPDVEFSDQVYMITLWIIDYFVKPDDIWMLEPLEYLELLFYAVVCVAAIAKWFSLKILSIHLLNCVFGVGVGVHAKVDRCELASPELFFEQVLVDLLALVLFDSGYFVRTYDRGLSAPWLNFAFVFREFVRTVIF